MANETGRRIRMITACVKGNYVNVYGLDELGRVWSWDPVKAGWKPYKITPQARGSRGRVDERRDEPAPRPRRDDW